MKHLALLFCATLLAFTAPAPSARADVSVSVGFFFDALDPYGDWVYTPSYGYIWQPASAQQADWSPYSDGYWAYTDAGWTWISNEDFGWATYHYGRWARLNSRWSWIPGYEWAPAWVSWRQNDDHVGWAPLPPEARWYANTGFSSWTDSYYDVGPSYYNFVPVNRFSSRGSLRPYIVDRSRNVTYIDNSVNVTNITYRNNVVNNIFVGGPDPSRLERLGGSPIRRMNLRRDDDGFRRDWMDGRDGRGGRDGRPNDFRSLSRIENDDLVVAAPSVRRDDTPGQPRRVRDNIESPEVDRGWRNAGDSKLVDRLRERQRDELKKIGPDKMPEKTPLVVTGKAPPKQLDRTPGDNRPGTPGRPGDPRGDRDEEVRKGLPPMADRNIPGRVQDQPPGDSKMNKDGTPNRKGGVADREDGPKGMPGRDGVIPGRPGIVDRPGGPTDRPGGPLDRDGLDRKGPPGRDGNPMDRDRKGLPGREGAPLDRKGGPPGRDDMPKGDRDGRPSRGPDLDRLPDRVVPGQPPSLPRATPKAGPSPEETPPRRVAPPDAPSPGGSIMPERKKGPPKAGPDMPEPKGPETRRSLPNPLPEAKPRVAPMPKPDVTPRTAPMPKPEPRRAEPRPMPQPKQNPTAVPQPRKEMPRAPEIRSSAPPKVKSLPVPQSRPAPQARPMPAPQARPTPAPRPVVPQAARPAPTPKPAAAPPAKKKDPRR
ncbi:MAG: DUF6600 domain-containing protein [Verrucomicrobiota bacterium]